MTKEIKLPLLPIRDPSLVVFPGSLCEVDLGRPFSIEAVNIAESENASRLIVAMQKSPDISMPSDFQDYCTEAEIKSKLFLDPEQKKLRIIVEGIRRGILKSTQNEDERFYGVMESIEEPEIEIDDDIKNLIREVYDTIHDRAQFINVSGTVPNTSQEFSLFVDSVAHQLPISNEKRIEIFNTIDPLDRLNLVIDELADVANNVGFETETDGGNAARADDEMDKLRKKIDEAGMPEEVLKVVNEEFRRLSMMLPMNSEFQVTYNYIETLSSLPWNKSTEDKIDIEKAKEILDEDHYGLKKVKERIIESLALRKLKPEYKGSILCFVGSPGTGKAQPLDAKVLTPNGFVNMGDMKIGDKVITPSGQVSNVIGVFPQGEKDVYKITLSDGSYTRSCKEHLWEVQNREDRLSGAKRVVTTESMMRDLYIEHGTRKNYSVGFVSPSINFSNDITLDPYLVGCLISEGQLGKVSFSNGDDDIVAEMTSIVESIGCKLTARGDFDYDIVKTEHNPADNINKPDNRSAVAKFIDDHELRKILSVSKFIPKEYKLSSFKDRERLLQGILDGDGSPIKLACAIEWSSASYRLSQDLIFLVQSLGGQATYSRGEAFYTYKGEKLQGKDRHRLRITLPLEVTPFLCSRKLNIYNEKKPTKRCLQRYISDISSDGRVETQCILIDHPSHLYITDNFIITHNTSSGKSIARAMGREFVRMSVGGVDDEAEIRGHRRTYVGALPGRIMENIKKVGSKNPVFMLDEVDKLSSSFRGDPSSALLEALDPEQNSQFVDHYLGVPFDLSDVMFICTVNSTAPLPPALRDRLEIIEIPGYSTRDKLEIAKGFLIPKQLEKNGVDDQNITFSDGAIERIVEEYTSESGVRSLERECASIIRKLGVIVASKKEPPRHIESSMVLNYLGPPKTFVERALDKPEVGVSTGLAWSSHGGSILFVEAVLTPGTGKVHRPTGNLGKVMKESVNAAYIWVKSNAAMLNITPRDLFSKKDLYLHFPAGAIPKDGPSAGIAIVAAMVSALTGRPVRNDFAMTGEITLRGRVLPIGGLKEKILAAHRAGIKNVIIPDKNKHDLDDIQDDVMKEIKLVKVSDLSGIVETLLLKKSDTGKSSDFTPGSGEQLINRNV